MNKFTDVLLVEDDPGDVHLALAVFRELQMADRCEVVHDGEDAMDFLRARGRFAQRSPGLPKLVLLDLKMPRVNGFDLLRQIRAHQVFSKIPIVVLSSSSEERDIERAYDLGANGYVVKGIDFADYRGTLQALAEYWGSVNERPPGFVERQGADRSIAHVERSGEWPWSQQSWRLSLA